MVPIHISMVPTHSPYSTISQPYIISPQVLSVLIQELPRLQYLRYHPTLPWYQPVHTVLFSFLDLDLNYQFSCFTTRIKDKSQVSRTQLFSLSLSLVREKYTKMSLTGSDVKLVDFRNISRQIPRLRNSHVKEKINAKLSGPFHSAWE